jgi:medium-chain acyl-[acyl-carrier-protein] hydrolase
MRAVWSEDIKVKVHETDFNGNLKLSSIFNYFQEAAGNHASDLDVGFSQLKEKNLFWVLSRIKIVIERFPKWGEQLQIETWPKGIDKLFALRDFRFTDKENKPIISGTSGWLLVDRLNQKLHRIEELGIYVPEDNKMKHAIAENLDKIKPVEGGSVSLNHKVTVNDIDILQHVNNSRYIEWIMDCYNIEYISAKSIKSIQVNYLDETKFDDEVMISLVRKNAVHYLEGSRGEDKSKVFQALIVWDN